MATKRPAYGVHSPLSWSYTFAIMCIVDNTPEIKSIGECSTLSSLSLPQSMFAPSRPPRSIHRLLPIEDTDSWDFYTKQKRCYWVVEEIDMSSDGADFATLRKEEQRVLQHVLAFFASSDSVVSERLMMGLYEEAPTQESRMFYAMQMAIEAIHTETYNMLINVCVPSGERDTLFNAVVELPTVRAKREWFDRACTGSWPQRLVVQSIVEGVMFSSSFAFIFWIKQRFQGKFPGLTLSNVLISRDEALHRDYSIMLYRRSNMMAEDDLHALMTEAIELEKAFVREAFDGQGLLGLSHESMCDYIEFVGDHLLASMGHEKLFGTQNPYPWMENLSLQNKENFFECKVGNYALMGDSRPKELEFDAEF